MKTFLLVTAIISGGIGAMLTGTFCWAVVEGNQEAVATLAEALGVYGSINACLLFFLGFGWFLHQL